MHLSIGPEPAVCCLLYIDVTSDKQGYLVFLNEGIFEAVRSSFKHGYI